MDLQSEHPCTADLNRRYVQGIHARGRRVFVYTVNDQEEMQRFSEMGVDGMFTDDPALALGILASSRS